MRINSRDHILLYCRLQTALCCANGLKRELLYRRHPPLLAHSTAQCCSVLSEQCSLLLSLLHLLPQSSSEGFSCATIHHFEFWCILKRLLFMYWPEAREGVCVSFKIHLALEGKAGGGRWTNQPTNHSHRAEVLLTKMRACCFLLAWQRREQMPEIDPTSIVKQCN